jgi:hypothetical protein
MGHMGWINKKRLNPRKKLKSIYLDPLDYLLPELTYLPIYLPTYVNI